MILDETKGSGAMDTVDWRTQLLPDSRHRIVNKITETLNRHLPVSGEEGVQELKKIALRFEEKIYTGATSQRDYLRKISLKMLTMETKSQSLMTNSVLPNAASSYQNAYGQASLYSSAQMRIANQADWSKGIYQKIPYTLSSGAKLGDCSAQVEERLKKIEADVEEVKTLWAGVNEKLNYLVKLQDVKIPTGIRHPAKHLKSSWKGKGQPKRRQRIVEIIRQSCKRRRLGRGAVEGVSPVECAKDDQRRSDEAEQKSS